MSNVPHRHTSPEERRSVGIFLMIMFGLGILLCIVCLVEEGISFWPVYISLVPCVLGVKAGYDCYQEAVEKINSRKK